MKTVNLVIILIAMVFFSNRSIGQKAKASRASDLLGKGDFVAALEEYELLLEDEPDNLKFSYFAGVCCLNINGDKTTAIPYLEKCVNASDPEPNAYYLLGRAYHFAMRFDDAMKMYSKYLTAGGGSAATPEEINTQIQFCENAKELIKYPLDISFENLGSNVNSEYADYYPFVPDDESFIVYNSKRNDGSMLMDNGEYAANVYMSKVENGVYQKARPMGTKINTKDGNEEVIGLNAKGDIMLLYYDNFDVFGDILISTKHNSYFKTPLLLDHTINSTNNQEISASITVDGNTIYFASDRKGGMGGTDIYVSHKLPIGGWGPPQNLGPEINTTDDEDFPNISPDGKTLYFSSKGHTGMGGYDIFKAEWDPPNKHFTNVRNMGYPLNTTYDDMNFRVSKTGRYGYIAAIRPEGMGNYDIYRITFNKIEPRYTVVKGIVSSSDTTKQVDDLMITVTDKNSGDVFGEYLPNPRTHRYIIALPSGSYEIFYDSPGYVPVNKDIEVYDKSSFKAEIVDDIVMKVK